MVTTSASKLREFHNRNKIDVKGDLEWQKSNQ